jgi:hypothetical protein
MDTHSELHAIALTPARILQLLSRGEMQVKGLIPWSSNATLLVNVQDEGYSALAVYKPQRGERPLWDFPHGTLGKREVAAYLLSEALGWCFIPPTLMRLGPYGLGSLQLFVHAQEDAHFFSIQRDPAFQEQLARLAAFDIIANNADRKSGHCLVDHDGRLWAIDNALTFHPDFKLRTVIWDFADQPLPDDVMAGLHACQHGLSPGSSLTQALGQLLTEAELAALRRRVRHLIQSACYPRPGPGPAVPWPLV